MAVLALALAATAARADEAREQQARQLYLEGKKAYDAQDYGRAIEMFKRAYRTLPNPALLYNISSAQQGLEQPHEAAETLRAYLRAVPDDPDRAAIEARIRALEESQRLLDQERAAVGRAPQPPTQTQTPTRTHAQTPAPMQTQTPPEPASAPGAAPATASTHAVPAPASPPQTQPAAMSLAAPHHPGRAKTYAGAAVGAVGVAAILGGMAASLSARRAADAVRSESAQMQPFDPSLQSAGRRDDSIAGAMYAIGAVAVVTGVVLVVLGRRDADRARAQLAPAGGSATVGVRF